MGTVTYKHQPGIHKTRGTVPLAGTSHVYTVDKVLWPEEVEQFIATLFIGRTLHLCSGASKLGDIRFDSDSKHMPDLIGDAAHTGLVSESFDTVLCDPPYNGKFQWNHDVLNEMARLAKYRIVFQHWFMPIRPDGHFKKWVERWALSAVYVWQPRTYFGRVQVISVLDRCDLS